MVRRAAVQAVDAHGLRGQVGAATRRLLAAELGQGGPDHLCLLGTFALRHPQLQELDGLGCCHRKGRR